jgi:hypothetical protein
MLVSHALVEWVKDWCGSGMFEAFCRFCVYGTGNRDDLMTSGQMFG